MSEKDNSRPERKLYSWQQLEEDEISLKNTERANVRISLRCIMVNKYNIYNELIRSSLCVCVCVGTVPWDSGS